MIPNFGVPELLIIGVIIVLLFGAKKVPELLGSLGKGIKEFKKALSEELPHEQEETETHKNS